MIVTPHSPGRIFAEGFITKKPVFLRSHLCCWVLSCFGPLLLLTPFLQGNSHHRLAFSLFSLFPSPFLPPLLSVIFMYHGFYHSPPQTYSPLRLYSKACTSASLGTLALLALALLPPAPRPHFSACVKTLDISGLL